MATIPVDTAAPAPPLEPPGVQSRFQGLCVTPCSSLSVIPRHAYSGVSVLPSMTAPWALSRSTTIASTDQGPLALIASEPFRVGQSFVSVTSLMAVGTPSRRPHGAPLVQRAAEARARRRARLLSINRHALRRPSHSSIRSRTASSTSSGEK